MSAPKRYELFKSVEICRKEEVCPEESPYTYPFLQLMEILDGFHQEQISRCHKECFAKDYKALEAEKFPLVTNQLKIASERWEVYPHNVILMEDENDDVYVTTNPAVKAWFEKKLNKEIRGPYIYSNDRLYTLRR